MEGTPSVDPSEKPFLGSNLVLQWMEGVKRYGWQRSVVQAFTVPCSFSAPRPREDSPA